MSCTGTDGSFISQANASDEKQRWIDNHSALPSNWLFDNGDISTVLATSGCTCIRTYLGETSTGTVQPYIVAVDSSGDDILSVGGVDVDVLTPSGFVSLTDASADTLRWQNSEPTLPKGFRLGKDNVQDILDITGAVSTRVSLGEQTNGDIGTILGPVNSSGHDITIVDGKPVNELNRSNPCPPDCGDANVMNHD